LAAHDDRRTLHPRLAVLGLVVLAVLLCLGYFVGAFVAFLWVAAAGVTLKGMK